MFPTIQTTVAETAVLVTALSGFGINDVRERRAAFVSPNPVDVDLSS